MRDIPGDLRDYDFTWSSYALEHLGSLRRGLQFFEQQLECLGPGGVAAHTTEFNISSRLRTVRVGPNVAYRRRDIERLVRRMRRLGHRMEVTFVLGDTDSRQEDGTGTRSISSTSRREVQGAQQAAGVRRQRCQSLRARR